MILHNDQPEQPRSDEKTAVDKEVRRVLKRIKKGRAVHIESAEGRSVPTASREAAAQALRERRRRSA